MYTWDKLRYIVNLWHIFCNQYSSLIDIHVLTEHLTGPKQINGLYQPCTKANLNYQTQVQLVCNGP